MIPSYIWDELAKRGTPEQQAEARRQLRLSEAVRLKRAMALNVLEGVERTPGRCTRRTYDAQGSERRPPRPARAEGDLPVDDVEVNEAHDGAGATWVMLRDVAGVDSLDNQGMVLESVADWDAMDNAYWDGVAMTYGRGDLFNRFTADLTVNGHEMGHGFIQFVWGAVYHGEPGALNEHGADVIGSLVEQYARRQSVSEADWLIGSELMSPRLRGRALRDMVNPGTAYDDPLIGRDPQPDHYSRRYRGSQDHGGVHINSGIGNRAYATAARLLGGYAWEHVGKLWVQLVMPDPRNSPAITYPHFAALTGTVAQEHMTRDVVDAVRRGWEAVGLPIDAAPSPPPPESDCPPEIREVIARLMKHPDVRTLWAWGRALARRSGG